MSHHSTCSLLTKFPRWRLAASKVKRTQNCKNLEEALIALNFIHFHLLLHSCVDISGASGTTKNFQSFLALIYYHRPSFSINCENRDESVPTPPSFTSSRQLAGRGRRVGAGVDNATFGSSRLPCQKVNVIKSRLSKCAYCEIHQAFRLQQVHAFAVVLNIPSSAR